MAGGKRIIPSLDTSPRCWEREDIAEKGRALSTREAGREIDGSWSEEPSPRLVRIILEIDFLTLFAASCFFRSDLATADAFLDCIR